MQTISDGHGKTPVQREISLVMKKAYCGFERLQKEHDARIQALLETVRSGRPGVQAA